MSRYQVETTHCFARFGDAELTVRAEVVVQRPMGRNAPSDLDCHGYAEADGLTVLMADGRDVTDELTDDEVKLLSEVCEELGHEADRDALTDYADHMLDRWKDEQDDR
jgi:hypothetical protein